MSVKRWQMYWSRYEQQSEMLEAGTPDDHYHWSEGGEVYVLASDYDAVALDAKRYRFLRDLNPLAVCSVAWQVNAATDCATPDEAVDSAIAFEAQV